MFSPRSCTPRTPRPARFTPRNSNAQAAEEFRALLKQAQALREPLAALAEADAVANLATRFVVAVTPCVRLFSLLAHQQLAEMQRELGPQGLGAHSPARRPTSPTRHDWAAPSSAGPRSAGPARAHEPPLWPLEDAASAGPHSSPSLRRARSFTEHEIEADAHYARFVDRWQQVRCAAGWVRCGVGPLRGGAAWRMWRTPFVRAALALPPAP